jgi:hypothetical protein
MQGQLRSLENPSSSGPQNLANHQSGCPALAATKPFGCRRPWSHDTNRRSGYGLQTKYTLYLTAVPSADRLPAWPGVSKGGRGPTACKGGRRYFKKASGARW